MTMYNDWGELIDDSGEGVFDESALGDYNPSPGGPATFKKEFPYAPQMVEQIRKIDGNRYALYKGDAKMATAGMGTFDDLLGDLSETGGQSSADYGGGGGGGGGFDSGSAKSSEMFESQVRQSRLSTGLEAAGEIMGAIGDAVSTGFEAAAFWQNQQLQQEQASAQLQMQMDMINTQLQQARRIGDIQAEAQLQQLLAQGQGALASGDLSQILGMLNMQRGVPTWVWVLGGVAVLSLGGLLIYKLV